MQEFLHFSYHFRSFKNVFTKRFIGGDLGKALPAHIAEHQTYGKYYGIVIVEQHAYGGLIGLERIAE